MIFKRKKKSKLFLFFNYWYSIEQVYMFILISPAWELSWDFISPSQESIDTSPSESSLPKSKISSAIALFTLGFVRSFFFSYIGISTEALLVGSISIFFFFVDVFGLLLVVVLSVTFTELLASWKFLMYEKKKVMYYNRKNRLMKSLEYNDNKFLQLDVR